MKKTIGPLLLSGLMIGPILGSGVIILPPLAYGKLGEASIWAWVLMMILGALFAMIFSKLSVLHPGNGGMTIAIEEALGRRLKLYSSLLFISAVSFGPSAVLLTAAEYMHGFSLFGRIEKPLIAILLLFVALCILLKDIKFISILSFIFSTMITLTLIVSSILVLSHNAVQIAPLQSVDAMTFGQVALLLFWGIIGWEIVGNYSSQVRDIKTTMPRATIMSVIVITITYLLIALAMQSMPFTESFSLTHIMQAVFGSNASSILALFVMGLCLCTYLLTVGAAVRLVFSLAREEYLPSGFQRTNRQAVAYRGLLYFTIVHMFLLMLTYFMILNIETIVAIANAFFLLNAVIGLIASLKLIDGVMYRIAALILSVCLLMILSFSAIEIFVALGVVFLLAVTMDKRRAKKDAIKSE